MNNSTRIKYLIIICVTILFIGFYILLDHTKGLDATNTRIDYKTGYDVILGKIQIDTRQITIPSLEGVPTNRKFITMYGDTMSLTEIKDRYGDTEIEIHLHLSYQYNSKEEIQFKWWFHKDDYSDTRGIDTRIYKLGTVGYHTPYGRVKLPPEKYFFISRFINMTGLNLKEGTYLWEVWWKENGREKHKILPFIIYE